MRRWLPVLAVLLLAACAGTQKKPGAPTAAGVPVSGAATAGATPVDCTGFVPYPTMQEDPATRGDYVAGGLYKPGVSDSTPDYLPRVDCIREPDVVALPRSAYGNRSPYKVLGKSYEVLGNTDGYAETGLASYYGNKFHGRKTSNHEVYDMYAFTAAHKSLPLPSFARVTNLENGRSVVVRVNDRGPFHDGRVVDLSYAAAVKLDIHRRGTGRVEVRALQPGEIPPGALPSSALPRAQAAVAAPAKASGMDSLVGTLPKGAAAMPVMLASASQAPPAAGTGAPTSYARAADHPGYGRESDRFRMVDENGRVRTADEFDAWLRERQARLQAEQAAATAAVATTATSAGTRAASATSVASPAPAAAASRPAVAAATLPGVTLQVGVFSVRDNADRALSKLLGAGIPGARMLDLASAGRTLYRVRVGPVEAASVKELVPRLTGLGFELPQVVRE